MTEAEISICEQMQGSDLCGARKYYPQCTFINNREHVLYSLSKQWNNWGPMYNPNMIPRKD